MTVRKFIERFGELNDRCMDYELTVRKHDKNQLRCHDTVPVESAHIGFDFTSEQVVLVPKFDLSTSQAVVEESMAKRFKEMSEEKTRLLGILARISMISSGLKDPNEKELIRKELNKVSSRV